MRAMQGLLGKSLHERLNVVLIFVDQLNFRSTVSKFRFENIFCPKPNPIKDLENFAKYVT